MERVLSNEHQSFDEDASLRPQSLKEYIAGYLANVCINVLSVAAAFVLIYIVVKVVINALHLFSKLPGLKFF